MPIDRYFKGEGEKVMAKMKDKYGEEKGERVFFATAKKKGGKAKGKKGRRYRLNGRDQAEALE